MELVAWAVVPVVVVMVAAVGRVEDLAYLSGCHRPLCCPGLAPARAQSMATGNICHSENQRRDTSLALLLDSAPRRPDSWVPAESLRSACCACKCPARTSSYEGKTISQLDSNNLLLDS